MKRGRDALKANNAGLPADRRETKMTMTGMSPHGDVPLSGSGYDKRWPTQGASIAGAGRISAAKANGGTCSKVSTARRK